MDAATAGRIAELARERLDWGYLLRLASRSGMTSLLYGHLKAVCPGAVPGDVLGGLRRDSHKTAAYGLALASELLGLLNRFEAHGIPAVPFKGPALAASMYGNLALRPFDDLDILVRRRDVLRAKSLLVAQGYRTEYALAPAQEALFVRLHSGLGLYHEPRGILVELQWELIERYFCVPFDPERPWARLGQSRLLGASVPALPPEDLLVFLCVHGAKHLWVRLCWICDVAELIRAHPRIDWGAVTGQARELGAERMLLLGLSLASELLGAPLPDDLRRRVRAEPAVETLGRQVCARLFRDTAHPPGEFELFRFHLRVRERVGHRCLYCLRRATTLTVRDLAVLPLPAPLAPLYHLLRPIRLAGLYLWSPFKRLVKGPGT